MTPNDAQIDVLLRRLAGRAQSDHATEHLDADELNAFAEGSLPAAARSRYVSHLADCDDCRKLASQLAITSGAVVAAEASSVAYPQRDSWWKRLSGFFTPLTLRYAAFAVVLVTVLGGVFLITRRQRETNFVAQNESANQTQVSAVKPADSAPPAGLIQAQKGKADRSASPSQDAQSPIVNKQDALKVAENPVPPPKPEQETSKVASPGLAGKKTAEPEPLPSYAPAPPPATERAETISRDRPAASAGALAGGPRKGESSADKSKMMDRSRAGEVARDSRAEDDNKRFGMNQPSASNRTGTDEKPSPRRDVDSMAKDRNAKEMRSQTTAPQSAGAGTRAASEAAPETRSAGGRKFRRQGNAWIDSKFKSSMTLKSISRGSSEFAALDSGLRSIAQQISGELIVVWKGKAYLIR